MSIRVTAQKLIDEGWAVVPIPHGAKEAAVRWASTSYEPKHFKDDNNIAFKCGEPSGWRVDVDCDTPEAIAAAHNLLPNTGLIWGRASKPTSHYIFVCKDIKTRQFRDVKDAAGKKAMIIEVRSTGGYTVMPPSLHSSGEPVEYEAQGLPMEIAEADLDVFVLDTAIVAFLLRHWSELHHEDMGHLAGFLLQAGLSPMRVRQIANTVSRLAPDHPSDIIAFTDRTIAKFQNGDTDITGGPKLAENLGKEGIAKLRGWLKVKDTDPFDEMNERHFFVRMGKDSVIGREDDPDAVVFQHPRALATEYANRTVQVGVNKNGDPVYKPLFQAWLASEDRRSHSKVVFAPPPQEARPGEYNLWKGYAVEPNRGAFLAGKCLPMLNHIREIICDGDPEHFEYLLNLLAYTVRVPGEPLGVCLVMRGGQGSGKGVFVDFLGALFHKHHYVHLTKMDQAIGRFNKPILGKIIVYLDEAAAEAAMRNHGTFKSLITDKQIQIELKGIDGDSVPNLAHVFVATNEERSVPTEEGDRRFVYFKVSDKYAFGRSTPALRKAYFDPLHDSVKDEAALGAFLFFLQHRNLTAFDRFDKVITAEELNQRRKSLRGAMRWLYELQELGDLNGMGWPAGQEIPVPHLYTYFEQWAQKRGERLVDPGPWGKIVAKYLWVDNTRNTRIKGKDTRVGVLVTIEELRNRLPPLSDFGAEVVTEIRVRGNGTAPFEVSRIGPTTATTATHAPAAVIEDDDDIPF